MSIKTIPESVPSKLPAARLYLDDLSEILEILSGTNKDSHVSFIVGDKKCETLNDLREIGGRTHKFSMKVLSLGRSASLEVDNSNSIYLYGLDDQGRAWSQYAMVAAVFTRRKLNLIWRFVLVAMVYGLVEGFFLFSKYRLPTEANLALGIALGWYVLPNVTRSTVCLYPSHVVGAGRWWDQNKSQVFMLFVGAVIGAIVSAVVAKFLK